MTADDGQHWTVDLTQPDIQVFWQADRANHTLAADCLCGPAIQSDPNDAARRLVAHVTAGVAPYQAAQTFVVPPQVGNRAALMDKVATALAVNQAFLALATPTAAQAAAQVQALTRQVQALLRIVGDQLDSTGGT